MKRKEEAMKKYIASFLAITQPALKAVSCTDIATGAGGHRYGLCQMGAALRAKNGDSASNILLYYYAACFESCKLHRYCNWCRRTSLRAMSNGCRIACKKW